MAGGRRPASSSTAGKAMTKACCCTSLGSARPPTRYRRRVMTPIVRRIDGRTSTVVNCCTRARSSPISSLTCGSTFAAFVTPSCGHTTATTFRTAGRRRSCSRPTRSAIPAIRRLWRALLGLHCLRRPWLGKRIVGGVEREFFDYIARGAPFGPDDGTVAPWVVIASLPFAPEIVIPTVRNFARMDLEWSAIRIQAILQPVVLRSGESDRMVGHALSLRHRSGSGRPDDRELPNRAALEHHASLSHRRHGTSSRGIHGGLAIASVPIAS